LVGRRPSARARLEDGNFPRTFPRYQRDSQWGRPRLLANEPARFSWRRRDGTKKSCQFASGGFGVPGPPPSGEVTLSANPDDGTLKNEMTVALTGKRRCIHYETAASEHGMWSAAWRRPRSESLELTPENKKTAHAIKSYRLAQ